MSSYKYSSIVAIYRNYEKDKFKNMSFQFPLKTVRIAGFLALMEGLEWRHAVSESRLYFPTGAEPGVCDHILWNISMILIR